MEVILRKLAWIVGFNLGQWWFGMCRGRERMIKSWRGFLLLFLFLLAAELGFSDFEQNSSGKRMDQRTDALWRDQVWVQLWNSFSGANCSALCWEVVSCRHCKVDSELPFLGSQLAGAALYTLWPPIYRTSDFSRHQRLLQRSEVLTASEQ